MGKPEAVRLVLLGVLASGHILIEDLPGLGKTLLARTFATVLGLEFTRVQFTPDMLPADLTGAVVLDLATGQAVFRPGPVFTGLLLADEINRTPPKTQAALLEAMAEGQVSADGVTRPLPQPFVVLATDNPIEYEGTYPLPEAQLDRFTARVRLGYLDADGEAEMVRRRLARGSAPPAPAQVTDAARLLAMRESLESVQLHPDLLGYVVALAAATRSHPQPPAGDGGRLAARHAGRGAAGPRPRRAGRPGVRDAGGHQGGRRPGAGPPAGAAAGDVGAAGDRGGRHRRGPGQRARPAEHPAMTSPRDGTNPGAFPAPVPAAINRTVRWAATPRARNLATAALLGLLAAIVTGHAALVLLAAPALGALALMPRRRPPGELAVDVALSAARCFEGEDVTVIARVRSPGGRPLDEIVIELAAAPPVTRTSGTGTQTFLQADAATARWVIRPARWGRYPPAVVRVACRAGLGGVQASALVRADPLDVFPRPARLRPRLVPAELLRRIGEHTGRAVGAGVEFAGLRPYQPGDQLRDVNRAVSIRRGQLHVNQRAAARAADLVVMIDAFGDPGPVADRALDLAAHGAAALTTAYLRVGDRAGFVVLGGVLRWLGPASGDRHFYRIAEMMLRARYESFVTPDVGQIPRTALPPGTLVVAFSPLLDPRALGALTDLRQRGFPVIVVDTLRDEPPPEPPRAMARIALRLWRLDRAATRAALADVGVPVFGWDSGTELDAVLAPLRRPPPGIRHPAVRS